MSNTIRYRRLYMGAQMEVCRLVYIDRKIYVGSGQLVEKTGETEIRHWSACFCLNYPAVVLAVLIPSNITGCPTKGGEV